MSKSNIESEIGKKSICRSIVGLNKFRSFVLCFIITGSVFGSTAIIGSAADVCVNAARTVHYDVAAIDINIPLNGWGDSNPQGMMYALNNPNAIPNVEQLKDPNFKLYNTTDATVPDKIQPLVLRANVGDCIEVTLTNRLDKVNDTIAVPAQLPGTQANIIPTNVVPNNGNFNLRTVGMEVTGLPYDPNISNGAYVGNNLNTMVGPAGSGVPNSRTYRWYAQRTGGYFFRDISNPQFPQDTINKGLFGMVIVEPSGSTWLDSITGRNLLQVKPTALLTSNNYNDINTIGTDTIISKPKVLGVGATIFAVVHQQPCSNINACTDHPLPGGTLLYENVSGNDYRSFAFIMSDEMEGIVAPAAWYENGSIAAYMPKGFFPPTGLKDDTFLINYKSEPLRNREGAWDRHRGEIPTPQIIDAGGILRQGGIKTGSPGNPNVDIILPTTRTTITVNASNMTVILPNGRKILPGDEFCGDKTNAPSDNSPDGPLYNFSACVGEESHLQSWPFGDPAMALPRAYWGDPVVYYVGTSSSHETHTFHQHTHRWFHDPDQADISLLPLKENNLQRSNRLDVQGIAPGEVFKIVFEQGAGSVTGTAGDSIFHCHLYPHFAGGLWSAFRVFDKLRVSDPSRPTFIDTTNINAAIINSSNSAIEPVLYPDGTQEAVLIPLPAKEAIITSDRKAPPAPRGMANRTAGVPNTTHPGYPNFVAGRFGLKALQPPMFVIDRMTGQPIKDRAIPTQLEINASYDGISPGVMLVDPCAGPNHEFGNPASGKFGLGIKPDRIYEPVAIQVPHLINEKGGFFNPETRAYVESELVNATRKDPSTLKPYSWRANVGDCVEFHATNELQPDDNTPTLGRDDGIFHGLTNTPEISNHIHIIRFDQLGTDGTSVNWNYDISTRSGETTGYRILADIMARTIFNHDHQFPTSHQQGSLHAAFIVEPMNSTYFLPNGDALGPVTANPITNGSTASGKNIKGVGTQALILTSPTKNDKKGGISGGQFQGFRELVIHYTDRSPAFVATDPAALRTAFQEINDSNILVNNPFDDSSRVFGQVFRLQPYNPPLFPDEYLADQGIKMLNYRDEPFQTRVNISSPNVSKREPAYVYSSRVHGDPYTDVFRAYPNDPVLVRIMDGAHEEHQTFEIHGHRWLHQASDPDSFLTDNQATNIGEWMSMELQGNMNTTADPPRTRNSFLIAGLPGDYLMGSTAMEDKWDGQWGIFRVLNGPKDPSLKPLPQNPGPSNYPNLDMLPQNVIDPDNPVPLAQPNNNSRNPCPMFIPGTNITVATKNFKIVAINRSMIYNDVYGENDPFGLMFVLASDKAAILAGTKKPEPLVIRASRFDCVQIDLSNELTNLEQLARNTPVRFPDGTVSASSLHPGTNQHYNDAQMPVIETGLRIGGTPIDQPIQRPVFNFYPWPMSNRTSLHSHMLKEVASVGDGATVGFMKDQTIGPGQTIRYNWYADETLGAVLLDSYGDERSHRHHGLFGALVIEPAASLYLSPKANQFGIRTPITSGTSAVILSANTVGEFREFVPLFMDGLNLRNRTNFIIPDLIGRPLAVEDHQPCTPETVRCNDVEDQGEVGINYRTERLENRAPLVTAPDLIVGLITPEELFNPNSFKVFSSKEFRDPATPVFEAFVGEPTAFRPLVPADLARVRNIGLSGHVWPHEPRDNGTNIVNSEGSFGVGKSFNYYLMGGAGGEQKQSGDYMYNDRITMPEDTHLPGGEWGILRVYPTGATPANITKLLVPAQVFPPPRI